MSDGDFEWDEAKAAENWRRHRVSFAMARAAFADPFGVEWADERADYGEERFVLLGMVQARLLYVAFTLRGDAIRIISARAAEPFESRIYHEENA
jgi:hypothetical protein